MPCFHPLKAFQIGVLPSGKADLMVVPYGVDHLEVHKGHIVKCDTPFLSPYSEKSYLNWKQIPCGHCDGCRIDRSRDWANRCMMELEYHKDAWFVTLTYNDQFVPKSWYADPATGEAHQSLTLSKRDWQLFMKRLRKATVGLPGCENIRFFMCGEYGPSTFRPHYHAILFGLHLDDLVPFSTRKMGEKVYMYYTSNTLQKAWSVLYSNQEIPSDEEEVSTPLQKRQRLPLGHVLVGKVTWETCAYVARYVLKKHYGPAASVYQEFNIVPEFTLMSRRPGIGRQWYDDHPDLYDFDFVNLTTPDGGKKVRPPKYFDRLFDLDDPDKMADIKMSRQRFSESQKELMLSNTTLTYPEILQNKERVFKDRIKSLRRDVL